MEKKKIITKQRIVLCVLGLIVICFIWLLISAEIIPYKRTYFRTYQDFWRKSGGSYYPDEETALRDADKYFFPFEEPVSTQKNTYYFYTGLFDKFEAVTFMVDAEEYQQLVDRYVKYYSRFPDEIVHYKNQSIPQNFLEHENISFLYDMLESDIKEYQIIAYLSTGDKDHKNMSGVIGNEETGHIIIFSGHDAFPANPD